MKEKELVFDRKKHVCYSKAIKGVILEKLNEKYPEEKAKILFEEMQNKYVSYLKDLPFLGGKSCTHNGAGGTYDCIMLCAYYEVLNRTPSIDELYEMNNKVLLPPFSRLGKIANMNNKVQQRIINKIFSIVSVKDKKLEKKCPTGYIMKVEPFKKECGIRYKFYRCPIAEFAKANNLLEIMPAFCNGDYPALKLLNASLVRKHTCSNYNYCDYQIVGDKSEIAKDNPMIENEEGYYTN